MSKINIQPLADRVLIQPAAAETKHRLGLSFPIPLKKNRKKELWLPSDQEPQQTQ